MTNTASKLLCVMCSIVVMLALVAGITSIQSLATANGIYIAAANPHYKHPVTGKIEDAGGSSSAVLGQSMTESALYRQALVEIDNSGNTYITIRLQLMDNIQNPQFKVSKGGDSSFSSVSASLMQEDYTENTADYRMKVPDENAIIRCNMYVTAMGREVIFYITVSDLKSGSGDFITSIKVENSEQSSTPAQTSKIEESSVPAQTSKIEQSSATTQISQPEQSSIPAQTSKIEESSATTQISQSEQSSIPVQTSKIEQNSEQTQTSTTIQNSSVSSQISESEQTSNALSDVSEQSLYVSEDISDISEASNSSSVENSTPATSQSTVQGIQEFDESGNRVEEKSSEPEITENNNSPVLWIVIAAAVVIVAGICVWYFVVFRKKK